MDPGLCDEGFRSFLSELPLLSPIRTAICEGGITEGEDCLAQKRFSSSKFPGHDGLPYELCLSLSHIIVLILTVVFRQRSILDRISWGVITLLKNGKDVVRVLDD